MRAQDGRKFTVADALVWVAAAAVLVAVWGLMHAQHARQDFGRATHAAHSWDGDDGRSGDGRCDIEETDADLP